jgi:hypothetical protein
MALFTFPKSTYLILGVAQAGRDSENDVSDRGSDVTTTVPGCVQPRHIFIDLDFEAPVAGLRRCDHVTCNPAHRLSMCRR